MTRITEQQLETFVASHGAALVLYARQWCNMPDDALQDALVDLLQVSSLPRDIVAWMFHTVRCKAMNLSRSERRRESRQTQHSIQRESWFVSRPDQAMETQELEYQLQALAELDREIVVARVWGELSFEQISQLTDKPVSTVHRRYQAAMAELKELLKLSNAPPKALDQVPRLNPTETKS